MDENLRIRLLESAGYTHHPNGIHVYDPRTKLNIRYGWTDSTGEGMNYPPMYNNHDEVMDYLQAFLIKHRLTVVMVLTFAGHWDIELVDKSGVMEYQHYKGTDFGDVIANAILGAVK